MKADRFDRFSNETDIADAMNRMTISEIASALDRTRAVFTRQKEKYSETLWATVWRTVTDTFPHLAGPRSMLVTVLQPAGVVVSLYKLKREALEIPFLYLTACLHYYAYASNVQAFVEYELSDPQLQFLIAENPRVYVGLEEHAVTKYHTQVKETLDELKLSDQRVLTMGLISRPDARNIKNKLYYRLFGVKPGNNVPLPLLYLPAEYLLENWTSINVDGRAFKLFLTMPEFTWNSVLFDQTLARVRVSHSHNSLALGLSTLSRIEVISVQDGKLLSRQRASYILGPMFADPMRNLTELTLVNLPSAVFPDNIGLLSLPRLQTFHIENVSRGRPVYEFIAQVLGATQRTLKALVLAGPDLLVPTDLSKLVIGGTLRSLTIKSISVEITSFPTVSESLKELTELTLTDLPPSLSDAQYRRLLSLSPVELTLDNLPISNASFSEMMRSADPDRLVVLDLANLRQVHDLDDGLTGKRALKTLRIVVASSQKERLNVPVRNMQSLEKFLIGGVEADKLQATLTTRTFTEWMRQRVVIEKGQQQPEAKRRLSFEAFPSPEKGQRQEQGEVVAEQEMEHSMDEDGVSFEAIETALQDMYAPFGSKGAGQFPERMPPASLMQSPDYALGNLLMQTWLEWDESMVAWLSNEHGEGIQMDTFMGDAEFVKRAIVKDGDVYSVEFSCKRNTQKKVVTALSPEDLEKDGGLDAINDRFWNNMDSVGAPLPLRLELVCKERVIGRSSETNAPLIDGSVHLIYPMDNPAAFSTSAPVEKQGGGQTTTRANVMYRGRQIGRLTRFHESTPSGYKFIVGFRIRLVLGELVRMMAAEDALLLATRPVIAVLPDAPGAGTGASVSGDKKTKEKDAAAAAESIVEASVAGLPEQLRAVTDGLLFPGRELPFSTEELVRHRVLANILYTTSTIATQLPFHWDEDNSQVLAAVQNEPERQMFGNWLSVAYLFSVGLAYLLETGGLGPKEQARERDLFAHFRRTLYEPVLLPVSRWCLAYSPSTGSPISTEESLVTVASAGDRLIALLKLIKDTVFDPNTSSGDVVSVATMLSPPVFDEGNDEDDADESVMQFVQAQSDFEDAVNEALDNDHHASNQFETRVGTNRRIFIDATKRLADIYIEAQTDHSGSDRFLDFARMTAFLRSAFTKSAGAFDDAARAIEAIKRDLVDEVQLDLEALSPGKFLQPSPSPSPSSVAISPSPSPKVVSPLSKKSKLVARDSASPADVSLSPLKNVVRVSLSPPKTQQQQQQELPPGKRFRDTRLATVIDSPSPPRSATASSSSSAAAAATATARAALERDKLPPLPGTSKDDPIILTQINHC